MGSRVLQRCVIYFMVITMCMLNTYVIANAESVVPISRHDLETFIERQFVRTDFNGYLIVSRGNDIYFSGGNGTLREMPQQSGGVETSLIEIAELMQLYSAAMKNISTRLEVLDDEFHITHKHNPIHHLECRLKGLPSIYKKMKAYGVPLALDSVRVFGH